MRYNDIGYVEQYKSSGKYPKIYDDIFDISSDLQNENIIDLGCCFGLLGHKLKDRNNLVIGIEGNKNLISKAIEKDGVKYINLKINLENIDKIGAIIRENEIKTVYARRIIPELYDEGGIQLLNSLVLCFYENFVEHIVLEGRKRTSRHTSVLHSIELECDIFKSFYDVVKIYKECRILQRK